MSGVDRLEVPWVATWYPVSYYIHCLYALPAGLAVVIKQESVPLHALHATRGSTPYIQNLCIVVASTCSLYLESVARAPTSWNHTKPLTRQAPWESAERELPVRALHAILVVRGRTEGGSEVPPEEVDSWNPARPS